MVSCVVFLVLTVPECHTQLHVLASLIAAACCTVCFVHWGWRAGLLVKQGDVSQMALRSTAAVDSCVGWAASGAVV